MSKLQLTIFFKLFKKQKVKYVEFYSKFIILMQAPKNSFKKNRLAAFLMILILGATAVFYIRMIGVVPVPQTSNDYSNMLLYYILSVMLSTLGWGLVIAYSQNCSISGLFSSLMATALTLLIQFPINYFYNYNIIGQSSASILFGYDYTTFATGAVVSLMITLCSLSGLLAILQLLIVIVLFNCGYSLAFNLAIYLNNKQWNVAYFDNNGGYFIYLFSGCFALTTSLLLNCTSVVKKKKQSTQKRYLAYVGLAGTGFIFATFPFTDYKMISGLNSVTYRPHQSPMNTYFSMTASVVTTFFTSILFNKGTIQTREFLIEVISGGVIISSVAAYIDNIGACIAVGGFAGFFSSFWLRFVHPNFNKHKVYDHMGIIGPITFNAIFGGLILAPLLFQTYTWVDTIPSIMLTALTSNDSIIFQLICAGLSMAIGLILGLITGLLCLIFRSPQDDHKNYKLVSPDCGLYVGQGSQPSSKVQICLQAVRQKKDESGRNLKLQNKA